MAPRDITLQVIPPCPACARRDTLVVLGDRLDRPHPWLVWRTRRTFICVCLHCGDVVTLEEQWATDGRRATARPPSVTPAR